MAAATTASTEEAKSPAFALPSAGPGPGEVLHECTQCTPSSSIAPPSATELPGSLLEVALAVLNSHDALAKCTLTIEARRRWREGKLPLAPPVKRPDGSVAEGDEREFVRANPPPLRPARPLGLVSVAPSEVPKPVPHQADMNRIKLIHSQCHIESYAIDLSWDILCRFVAAGLPGKPDSRLPREFYDDWLRVAFDEAKHFDVWRKRLIDHGSFYGAVPVHDGLWQSAQETRDNLMARCVIVHAVHEARGLDQGPKIISKLSSGGDKKSAQFLQAIQKDELTHVAAGLKWLKYACANAEPALDPMTTFHSIVRDRFRGALKPPFNHAARYACGFTRAWYLPMVAENYKAQVQDEMAILEKELAEEAERKKKEQEEEAEADAADAEREKAATS